MKKYGLHIVIVLLCILQILSLVKIVELKKDADNTGNYLSQKIDNLTSKVNMLKLETVTDSEKTK